jgi:riboflavin synthase
MFTGIIEELGTIRRIETDELSARLEVTSEQTAATCRIGESLAVNGVCLTIVEKGSDWVAADVSDETLRRTSLGNLRPGSTVNLERPLTPSSLLGGHVVQGHVDATGSFIEARRVGDGYVVRIGHPRDLGRYIVEKGSIAIDGISLTVAATGEDWFEIAIIPHTWRMTNLSRLDAGQSVNLEVDILAKYVEKMMAYRIGVETRD